MRCVEQQKRAEELFLPRILEMHEALDAGLDQLIQDLPTKTLPLFYLHLDSDGMLRPTIELCDALKGKTDDLWVKKAYETTPDEDLIRCVAIGRYLSFKVLVDDVLADRTGGHSYDFEGYPHYRLTTEIQRSHDGSDHIVQEWLYISLTPDFTAD